MYTANQVTNHNHFLPPTPPTKALYKGYKSQLIESTSEIQDIHLKRKTDDIIKQCIKINKMPSRTEIYKFFFSR